MGLRSGPATCGGCAKVKPPTDATLAGIPYAYPWSRLIANYKFGEQHGWASFFADLLCQTPGVIDAFGQLDERDWVLPLPLSPERLQSRGFNQAWALASALAHLTNTVGRTDARLLLRVKNTRPQSLLKRDARLANVKGAFQVDPLRVAELEGRQVILIDDVMTSGASVFTAAQALKDAGAARVTAIVLARTAAT